MEFRKAILQDLNGIINIIESAKRSLRDIDIDQWQDGYPNEESIAEDIKNGVSYVLCENDKIVAVSALSFDGEPTYEKIYDGQWISDGDYAVIHRFAVDNSIKRRGVASKFFEFIKLECQRVGVENIKVDTHRGNLPMRAFLEKNNFVYCGIIHLFDGSERVAYEMTKNL